MSIHKFRAQFKEFFTRDEHFYALLIVLVAAAAFGLGRLSNELEQKEHTAQTLTVSKATSTQETAANIASGVVGSVNGTKYHLPWCPGAQQMNPENKRWFETKTAAEAAGYTAAENCKGL